MGGAKVIIDNIGNSEAVLSRLGGPAPQGLPMLLGERKDPLPMSTGHFVVGERGV